MLIWDLPFHLLSCVPIMPHHPVLLVDQKGYRLISHDSELKLREISVASIEGSINWGGSGRIDHYEPAIIYCQNGNHTLTPPPPPQQNISKTAWMTLGILGSTLLITMSAKPCCFRRFLTSLKNSISRMIPPRGFFHHILSQVLLPHPLPGSYQISMAGKRW